MLKRRSGSVALAIAMALLCGCAASSRKEAMWKDAAIGAAAGGVIGCGGAAGTAALNNSNRAEAYEIGCPTGVGLGAIIGGAYGYLSYKQPPAPPAAPVPPPPPPPPPPAAPVHERIVLRGVHFDFNRANIRSDAVPVLDEAVEILKQHPDVSVQVNGYCDAIGSAAYNLRLSQRRADAVAAYLESHGIQASRVTAQGFGKTDFVAPNNTAEGRAQNRRVELVPSNQ